MFIEFFDLDPSSLPWLLVWLDDKLSYCWKEFLICVGICLFHYIYQCVYGAIYEHFRFADLPVPIFCGIGLWSCYCALRYGYGVG